MCIIEDKKKKTEEFYMLSERLMKITECIKGCGTIADIGTDHGYIPIYCVLNGLCESAIACDVNVGPLNAAKENIAKEGLSDKIGTRLSDGLDALKKGEADAIVIAGMGGFLIRDILERGADKIEKNTLLILQPMVAMAELRQYLYKNGYDIFDEKLAREDTKFYNIICARKGKSDYSEKDIFVGRNIEDDENYGEYIAFHKNVINKIIKGLEKSEGKETEIEEYKRKLELF